MDERTRHDHCGACGAHDHAAPATAADIDTLNITVLAIPAMCCASEFGQVEKALRRISAVREVSPDFIRRSVRIRHADVDDAALIAAAERSGFEVRPEPGAAPRGRDAGAAEASPPARFEQWPLVIGGVLALAAEGAALAYDDRAVGVVALALGAIAFAGVDTYRKGLRALLRLDLDINALMTVAVTGAALLGQWPEAAMVMVLFAIAERIEDRSLTRARRAVEGLMAMAPDTASIQHAQGWREVPAASVALAAIVRVRPGERIALDGQVTAGESAVDQSAITGESAPVDKQPGDALFAGTVNQNGELHYRVTARADDSTLARIVRSVQEAQATRAPTQRFVDAFARVYTPVVFAVAVGVAVVPPLAMGAEWMTWVYRALVLLVIACPCALVLSTPISVVSGLTAAARRGILVKGGLFLEQGHRLRTIALDKTGTLTLGKPVVTDVIVWQGTDTEAMTLAGALAARSDHPASRAIAVHAAGAASPGEVERFAALPGRGVEGEIGAVRYRLGNPRLAEETGAATPEIASTLATLERQGKTTVLLLRDRTALAVFAIADAVRPESAQAVAQLKALGIRPVMLTGDNRHAAEAVARQVGIDDVRSGLLPEDKLRAVAALSASGALVGMMGDGVNDAPALARADIGFAMGAAGTDTAIETADVALMDDDPRKLAEFVRLSRATRRVLWQNIGLALGIKAVFLALALAGQATLWMAVFADMGASLLVVFNGLRLLKAAPGGPALVELR